MEKQQLRKSSKENYTFKPKENMHYKNKHLISYPGMPRKDGHLYAVIPSHMIGVF